jgi:outer membrane protein assembly factor BamB
VHGEQHAPAIPVVVALIVALRAPVAGCAADWPQFRGPVQDGSTDETGLPSSWTKARGVLWRTALPGPGAATPAVVGDRIYLSTYDRASGEVAALCLDRASGRILWRVPCGPGVDSRESGRENFGASPSPVVRGTSSWFLFGSGVLVALDGSGKVEWRRDVQKEHGPFRISFGYASSPLLHDGTLYVQIVHRARSRVLAVDPVTGRDRWVVDRASDALEESQEAYTTPVPMTAGGRSWILVLGGDRLTAHDPATGRIAWQWAGYNPRKAQNFRIVPSPVVSGSRIFVNAPQLDPLYGLVVDAAGAGVVWTHSGHVTDVPTPALAGQTLVLLSGRQRWLSYLDVATGRVLGETRLADLNYLRASPLVADGKVYVIDADGEVRVFALGDHPRLVGRSSMGEYPCQSGIVAARGQLFVRTGEALYCIAAATADIPAAAPAR